MNCKSCNTKAVVSKLIFGEQPPSNRYQVNSGCETDTYALELGICINCGLIQLLNPMPISMVRSRYNWIKYNEPEFHLDNLVEELIKLNDLNVDSKIVGLTYKDDTTLARFEVKGFRNLHSTQMSKRNDTPGHFNGLETIQQIVADGKDFGLDTNIDFLLVRHLLEHAHNLTAFLNNIAKNGKEGGYLVFEIPDSKKFLQHKNYCFVWEEHIVYFTETTLRSFFEKNGFEVVRIFRYEAALEDSLVALIRNTKKETGDVTRTDINIEIAAMDTFANAYPIVKAMHKEFLQTAHNAGKKIAVFGAGHLAAKYINLFELKDLISSVIDDSKDKEQLYMPGSSVAIKNSSVLAETDICLLALSPESQEKVLGLKRNMIKPGGQFYSVFDNSLTSI